MQRFKIWDLPTRLFHWAFSLSVILAFVFAFAVGEHSPLFQLHMLFGLAAAFLLVLRIALGLFGSRHARFASFPLQPAQIAAYFTGILTGQARKYAGHNPGSALATLAMFALVPLLVLTGTLGGGEALEESHEILAYTLLTIIGLHLLGLALHTLRHRENIALSMVDGRKVAPAAEAITSSHPAWAAALAAAAGAWIVALFASHDTNAATVRLPVIGTVVQLGENERSEGPREAGQHRAEREHDDD